MLTIAAMYMGLMAIPYVCPDEMSVTARTLGPFSLGENISVIKGGYPSYGEAFEDDGDGGVSYTVSVCGHLSIDVTTTGKGNTVTKLSTSSPIFITAEGAKVGMTVAELQKRYPQGQLHVLEGEGLVAKFDTGTRLNFDLDEEAIPLRCYRYRVNCDALLKNVPTVSLFIWER